MDLTTPTHVLRFDGDPDTLLPREWLVTGGTGAYAMGTALGCPSRKYHALLVTAVMPPVNRIVALNHMFEQLRLTRSDGRGKTPPSDQPTQTLELTTAQFQDQAGDRVFAPRGFDYLECFERGLSVKWRYRRGAIRFTRELLLHQKEQAATLRYRVSGLREANTTARLRLSPMMSLRDFHGILHSGDDGFAFQIEHEAGRLTVQREQTRVTLACAGSVFSPEPDWWYGLHYPIETGRGEPDREDLYVPGAFDLPIEDEATATLTIALGDEAAEPIAADQKRAKHLTPIVERLQPHAAVFADHLGANTGGGAKAGDASDADKAAANGVSEAAETTLQRALSIAADDFIVERQLRGRTLSTILAGYPWFADWGRDTFIALPGLLLATQRYEEAKGVLRVFAEAIDGGRVPNRFDDYTEEAAHYNAVDASLWFIEAALKYLAATADHKSWKDWLASACIAIVEAYMAGTGRNETTGEPLIRMDDDGLIAAGNNHTQLTWMDAANGEVVFTPRPGKVVEINALWYNALVGLAESLPRARQAEAERYQALAKRVRKHFTAVFWSEPAGYLFDHVHEDAAGEPSPDPSLRPNQLFACSLPRSPLPAAKQKRVVARVHEHLLTPAGLRTLPVDDPNYHPVYRGSQFERDGAYHQGTIWPWLIGPYGEAALRCEQFSTKARRHVSEVLAPLAAAMIDTNHVTGIAPGPIGQLAEIYEAQPTPAGRHLAAGCPAQAWSVAELVRLADLLAR